MKKTQKTTKASTTSKAKVLKTGDNKKQIDELLKKLKVAPTQHEKKSIRRALRALGHTGGLKGVKVKG